MKKHNGELVKKRPRCGVKPSIFFVIISYHKRLDHSIFQGDSVDSFGCCSFRNATQQTANYQQPTHSLTEQQHVNNETD